MLLMTIGANVLALFLYYVDDYPREYARINSVATLPPFYLTIRPVAQAKPNGLLTRGP